MIGRRQILKAIGLSPAAAAVAIPALEASAAGIGVGTALNIGAGYAPTVPGSPNITKVLNWASWLKKMDVQFREQARDVRVIDADLAVMRLPLNTKIKWQQERNFERLVSNNKTWFDRELERHGFVEHWG